MSRWFLGNPNIDVSTVNNYELNWEHQFYDLDAKLNVAAFYQTVDKMQSIDDFAKDVVFVPPSTFTSVNASTPFRNHLNADVAGGELEFSGNYNDNWRYSVSYSLAYVTEDLLDANSSGGIADEDPIHRYEGRNAERIAKLNVGYTGEDYTIDTYAFYTSAFTQDRNNADHKIDDNIILSVNANYDVTENITLSATAIGLLDSKWQESKGLEAERQIFFRVKYKF